MDLFDLLSKWNRWFIFVPTLVGFVTLLYKGFTLFVAVQKYLVLKDLKSGIYYGYWVNPQKKQINCETLKVRKRINGLKASPVYKHASFHNYRLKVKALGVNKWIFRGTWRNVTSGIYKGAAMFHYKEDTQTLEGRWLGPRDNSDINGGKWILKHGAEGPSAYLDYLRHRQFYRIKERLFAKKSIVDRIIAKHQEYKLESCTVENITLELTEDSFIPTLGKVSIPLIKYASKVIVPTDDVLDLGTGTGFYPIYLAKNVGCKAHGIDISDTVINLAHTNAANNGVGGVATFSACPSGKLFSGLKEKNLFDVIIANLPFSRQENVYRARTSRYYASFAGSRDLLEQFILGSQYHLKPNGKVIFCYGESGYMDFLQSLVNVSGWKRLNIIETIRHQDDHFHICQLEFNDQVKSLYEKMEKE